MVQEQAWWWGLKDQVKDYVKACEPCKIGHAKFHEPMEMQPIPVTGIYHKVGIDMIGPIQTSKAGNKCIITAIDYMSKWIEAAAVPDKNSSTTADFLYRNIITRHGTPVEVVSDQGGEFKGAFQDLLDKCGIDHRLTSPYHPQANGLTERANQTLTRSLIKVSKEDPHNWDTQIPTILMGYHATRQASIKHSPFMLLHGHEMTLPQPMKRKTVSFDLGEQPEADTLGPLHATLKTVLDNIGHAQSTQAAQYAKRQLHGALPSKTVQDTVKQPSELVQDTVITPGKTRTVPSSLFSKAVNTPLPSASKTDVASPQTTVGTVTNRFDLDPELDAPAISAVATPPIKLKVEQEDSTTVVHQTSDQTK